MNILLVVPKYNLSLTEDYNYSFPLGLAYISSVIKQTKKHDVVCLNLNHYSGSVEEIVNNTLNKKNYDLVCTGGNALAHSTLKKIITTAKTHSSHPITILGGPVITSEPNIMFEIINPDIAVSGEGEVTIIELLNCLEKKLNFDNLPGIVHKNKENKIIITEPREQIKDIEKIPLPDLDGMEFDKYLDHARCNFSWLNQTFDYPRPYPLLGSRGCPFSCTFCWHPEKYRARSIKDIMKEIRLMVPKYKINFITIYDDCFSANKERLYDFCREIKKFSSQLSWELKWSCQLLVTNMDEEMLNLLKDAGCENISYGFESFSPAVLRSMRKPISPAQIDKALKATLKANIGIQGNFIFGDVAETKDTAKETLDYWKSCPEAQQISLGFVQPYPGSNLYNHCINKGIIPDKIHYIQNQMGPDIRLNMTDKMTDEEVSELNLALLNTFQKYFHFVTPKNLRRMSKNNYEFDFKCPFCKQSTHYKNCFIENKLTYGFHLICRKCHMRSALVGPVKKIAYQHYTKTRKIRDIYTKVKRIFKQKRI